MIPQIRGGGGQRHDRRNDDRDPAKGDDAASFDRGGHAQDCIAKGRQNFGRQDGKL